MSYNITVSGTPAHTPLGVDPNQVYIFAEQNARAFVAGLPGVTAASGTFGPLGHVDLMAPQHGRGYLGPPIHKPPTPGGVVSEAHVAHPGYVSGL